MHSESCERANIFICYMTYWTHGRVIISSIDCLGFSTSRVGPTGAPSPPTRLLCFPDKAGIDCSSVSGHYTRDPIVQGSDPSPIILLHFHRPTVLALLISHYCVTVAASLSTPSVMYDLCAPSEIQGLGQGEGKEGLQHHQVVNWRNYINYYHIKIYLGVCTVYILIIPFLQLSFFIMWHLNTFIDLEKKQRF